VREIYPHGLDAGEFSSNFLGDGIGEVFLFRISGKVG